MFRERLSRFLILVLVAGVVVAVPGQAVAQDPDAVLRFEGGGWGHGVGMSQYGALGRAEDGIPAEDILEYYYDGTGVEDRSDTITEYVGDGIRVNLGQGRPDEIRITIDETRGAPGTLTVDIDVKDPVTPTTASSTVYLRQGAQVGDSVDGSLDTWRWVQELDGGGDSCVGCIDATPVVTWSEGSVVGIGEITGSSGGKPVFEYGTHDTGALHFVSRDVGETDGAFVVLVLPLDDYLHGLAEMPPTWHPEALRAQAIAGRSYAVHRAIDRENADFDVFDSVQDQVYGGFEAKLEGRIAAADSSSNLVVTVDDLVVQTFYSSSNGGYSESTENSSSFGAAEPWHISKPDPYDAAPDEDGDPQNPFAFTQFEFTVEEVSRWLADYSSADLDVGTVLKITVDELPPSGRITNALVTVFGTDRTLEIRGFDGDGGNNPDGPPFGLRFQAAIQRGCQDDYGNGGLTSQCPSSSNFTVAGFFDVGIDDFFYEPVLWMAAEGITDGVGENEFGPNLEVTRSQFTAFVHRFAGEPEPIEPNGFEDVPEGVWYDAPVSWMKEQGITTGTTPTTFSPGLPVTRGQLATFLYRLAGEPEVEPSDQFVDVPPEQFYTEAVAWMVAFDITNGTSTTTFSPSDVVTRGQMATFLYRLAGLPEAFAEGTELPAKMRVV
ncbi:MAG: SpoIID/LytB domain-containing protein [Actinomycetota bacterium]